MDPRFKTLPFLSTDERKEVYIRVMDIACNCNQENTSEDSSSTGQREEHPEKDDDAPEKDGNSIIDWSLYSSGYSLPSERMRLSLRERVEAEWRKYMECPPIKTSPTDWWANNGQQYPLLAKITKYCLSIPDSSVPSERLFSTAGQVISARRNRLSPETVNMILFLHHI